MAKKILQDVVFNKRPEVKNIPISSVKIERPINPVIEKKEETLSIFKRKIEHQPKKERSAVKIAAILGVGILMFAGIVFTLSSYFSHAIVKITPLKENIFLDDIFSANLGKAVTDDIVDSLHFQTMKVTENDFVLVTATGVENVSKRASGHILVFNDYSTEPQKLISGTRFESPTGKIYKIEKGIIIPGKAVSGGKSIPGSIDVIVYASEPGEEYNSGPTDYTIPGLKGGPRYAYVYARGKGDISGGFSGTIKTALPKDTESAELKLEDSLKKKLIAKAKLQVPENFILYDDGMFIDVKYDNILANTKTEAGKIKYSATGTLKGIIFDKNELARFLALKKIPDLKNYDVHGNDLEDLILKMIGKSGVDVDNDKAISFKLSGNVNIVWNFDIDSFKEKLIGLSKYKYEELFKDRPMVKKVEAVLSPTWLKYFPDNIDKIEVKIEE